VGCDYTTLCIPKISMFTGYYSRSHLYDSLPSERLDVAARSAATLILGFECLFWCWEGSKTN